MPDCTATGVQSGEVQEGLGWGSGDGGKEAWMVAWKGSHALHGLGGQCHGSRPWGSLWPARALKVKGGRDSERRLSAAQAWSLAEQLGQRSTEAP